MYMNDFLYQYGWIPFGICASLFVYLLSPNTEEALPMIVLTWVLVLLVDRRRKKHRTAVEGEGLKMNIVVSMRYLMKKGRKTSFNGWTTIVHDSLENLAQDDRYREYESLYHRLVKSQPSGQPYYTGNFAGDALAGKLEQALESETKYVSYRDERLVLVFAGDELIWIGDTLSMIGANYLQDFFAEAKEHGVNITDNVSLKTTDASK